MRLRSPFFIGVVVAFLALFFTNTWQGYRYQSLDREVGALEQVQKDWLEKNKKAIAALAVLSSPARVVSIAVHRLGLKRLERREVIELRLEDGKDE
jgi:predicted negative regulator of RcsB-dependent stress response